MSEKTPLNGPAEMVVTLEQQNKHSLSQIEFWNEKIRVNNETISALEPLAEWSETPTVTPSETPA